MRLTSLEQTGYACPSQWEGEAEDGTPIYVRYKWGHLTVSDESQPMRWKRIFEKSVGDGLDGQMSTEDMLEHTGLEIDAATVR